MLRATFPDVGALSDSNQDRELLKDICYYKYTTTKKQEVIPTFSKPVILPEGTDVIVVDKDDDGMWDVSQNMMKFIAVLNRCPSKGE